MAFTITVSPVVEINGVADDQVSLSLVGCTAGNAILGGCYWSHASSTITSITATGESNAVLVGSPARTAGANGDASVQLFYFQNLAASGTKTVQANFSAEYGGVGFFALEVAGGNVSLPDTNAGWHNEATGTGDTPSISLVTNQAGDFLLAMVAGGTGADPTQGAGFTLIPIDQFGVRNAGEYDLDVGAAGTPSAGFTLGSSDDYAIVAAAFRVAAGGGSPYTLTAEYGTYSLSGSEAYRDIVVAAAQGSYTLTGQDVILDKGFTLIADYGSYTVLGSEGLIDLSMLAAAGTYTVTGQDAVLNKTFLLTAAGGVYALTGQVASLVWSNPPTGVIVAAGRSSHRGMRSQTWIRRG